MCGVEVGFMRVNRRLWEINLKNMEPVRNTRNYMTE